jgi:RNA polymerase sigma-70 factor (TIGR02960 family)
MIESLSFEGLATRHRRELHLHCYRMVASFHDADDLVQETLLRAFRALASFDASSGDSGLRAWLYRIATNACLDFMRRTPREASRAKSFGELPWLEPYPDRLLDELPAPTTPETLLAQRQTLALGYLALIQRLPARQRAIFLLREVLDWSAEETAGALATSVAAVNSGLQRARATLATAEHTPTETSGEQRALLAAFIDAHERGDTSASIALMREDIRVTMPPRPVCYQGKNALLPLLAQAFAGNMGTWRLLPTQANGQPAAVSYLRRPGDSEFRAFKIDVLRTNQGQIQELTTFDTRLVEQFGLPLVLSARGLDSGL